MLLVVVVVVVHTYLHVHKCKSHSLVDYIQCIMYYNIIIINLYIKLIQKLLKQFLNQLKDCCTVNLSVETPVPVENPAHTVCALLVYIQWV